MKLNVSVVLALAFVAPPLVVQAGGFLESCCQVSVSSSGSDATVYAQCFNDAGQLVSTSIDLNSCLTNNNGDLQFMEKSVYYRPSESASLASK